MTTTISVSAPTPADKAEMIRRHFPALMPTYNANTGMIEAPSQRHAGKHHTIRDRINPDGTRERVCSCQATRTCVHLLLAADLKIPGLVSEPVHLTMDADFDARHAHLMRAS